jgi:hypothetical protein
MGGPVFGGLLACGSFRHGCPAEIAPTSLTDSNAVEAPFAEIDGKSAQPAKSIQEIYRESSIELLQRVL